MALLEPRATLPLGAPDGFRRAALKQINGTDPAAGTEVVEVVPAGVAWQLVSLSVALVQGLTQTPQPILVLDDGADVVFESFGASAAQAASTTCRYTWAADLQLSGVIGAGAGVHANAPLTEGLILPAGYRIRTSTLGIGAGSDYGAPSLLVVEFTA